MLNFGYACINMTLRAKKPTIFNGRACIKRVLDEKGLPHVSRLIKDNTADILPILQWNLQHDINLFRISSAMCSWATEYQLCDLPDYEQIVKNLSTAGTYALTNGIRLSFHPGQFNVLSSDRDSVFANTSRDLDLHGELMDLLLQPRTPRAKINIHVGGTYGDKQRALEQFARNFERLHERVRSRLTVENDDKASCYSVIDLLWLHERLGIPIVFDYHHHKFCSGGISEYDALTLAINTWPKDIRPTVHYAESRDEDHLTPAHSNWIEGPIDDWGYDLDCMLECKMKELALLKYREKHRSLFSNTSSDVYTS